MEPARFTLLADFSVRLHGHKYVFPVAVWLSEATDGGAVCQPEIRRGLVHAESNRIFEALTRLVEIEALRELPKTGGKRYFEIRQSPYWQFLDTQVKALQAEANPQIGPSY